MNQTAIRSPNNGVPGLLLVLLLMTCAGFPQPTWGLSVVNLLNPQSPTNFPFSSGGPVAALNDPFFYDPEIDYADPVFLNSAQQRIDIPQTAFAGRSSDFFISARNGGLNSGTDATNFLNVDVSFTLGQSLDFLDFWGRTDHAGVGEEDRHQDLTITFYDQPGGSAGSGSILGSIANYDGVTAKDASNTPGSAYGRLDVASLLSAADRSQVASFEIDHVGSNTFLLFAEIRAVSIGGVGPGANPVLIVDRATGEMSLVNETIDETEFSFSAYSLRSEGQSSLVPSLWNSIADTGDANSGGTIDNTDNWVEFSAPGSTGDLSEGEAPGGDGLTLGTNGSVSLGKAWLRGTAEDLSLQVVGSVDQVVDVDVRFVGEFLPGDYDNSGTVTTADYDRWREQFGLAGPNLSADGNLDGAIDAADYTIWRDNLEPTGSLALASAVPEPAGEMTLLGMLLLALPTRWQRKGVARTITTSRRSLSLLSGSMVVALLFAGEQRSANAQSFIETGDKIVRLEKFVEGLNGDLTGNTANTRLQYIPIDLSPTGDGRQLILTLSGHVRLLQVDGTLASGAYLDTTNSRTPSPNAQDFTQIGATGIAVHPGFLDPQDRGFGKFYTITSERSQTGMPAEFSLNLSQGGNYVVDSVINEWTVDPSAIGTATQLTYTPDVGSASDNVSVREILRSQRPGIIHTLADLAFDSVGNLLVTSGDGGGNAFPNTDGAANGQDRATNSQDPTNIFGSILRIDPLDLPNDTRATGGVNNQYRIPSDNFFATDSDPDTPAEFFAYGFRSPYRLTVDTQTDRVFIGDVGEASREEISLVTNGGNYGWGGLEGTRVNNGTLAANADNPIDPLFELYHNLGGQSEAVNVVGGFVYRGTAIPELQGKYIFADTGEDEFTQSTNILDLFYGDPNSSNASTRDDFFRLQLELPDGLPDRIWSIAEDENGELLLLVGPQRIDLFDLSPFETDGGIWRILPAVSLPLNGIAGDVNQDGFVNGDGTDLVTDDDVAAFVAGWLSSGHETTFEQFTKGDLNLDGITDLSDWILLKANHEDGALLSLGALLSSRVPEPSALGSVLFILLSYAQLSRRWRR